MKLKLRHLKTDTGQLLLVVLKEQVMRLILHVLKKLQTVQLLPLKGTAVIRVKKHCWGDASPQRALLPFSALQSSLVPTVAEPSMEQLV